MTPTCRLDRRHAGGSTIRHSATTCDTGSGWIAFPRWLTGPRCPVGHRRRHVVASPPAAPARPSPSVTALLSVSDPARPSARSRDGGEPTRPLARTPHRIVGSLALGSDHSRSAPPAPPRVRRILVATVVPLFVATVLAAVVLWPREGTPQTGGGADGAALPRHGDPGGDRAVPTVDDPRGHTGHRRRAVRHGGRTDRGRAEQRPAGQTPVPAGPGAPRVEVGDEVMMVELTDPTDPAASSWNIAEHQRGTPLVWLAVVFAAAIVAFGRWRGPGRPGRAGRQLRHPAHLRAARASAPAGHRCWWRWSARP